MLILPFYNRIYILKLHFLRIFYTFMYYKYKIIYKTKRYQYLSRTLPKKIEKICKKNIKSRKFSVSELPRERRDVEFSGFSRSEHAEKTVTMGGHFLLFSRLNLPAIPPLPSLAALAPRASPWE